MKAGNMSDSVRKFSLVTEPWVTVLTCDGDMTDVSLIELFDGARRIKCISGEMSCQDVAVLRFLISLVYRACDPLTYDAWKRLWASADDADRGGALSEAVGRYLELNSDRFYLFDDEHPFYQVHDLVPNKVWGPSALMQYPTGSSDLFKNPHEKELKNISYAEAARWVLSSNMYDVCGIHTSYSGDPYAKSGKTFPPVPFGAFGSLIHLNGTSLYETLLLNAVPVDSGIFNAAGMRLGRRFTCGTPSYECDDIRPDETYDSKHRIETMHKPRSIAESLTWRSRSIRLFESENGSGVAGCIVTNGHGADIADAYGIETMYAFRGNKDGNFIPVTYDTAVSIITSIAPLISVNSTSSKRPGVIEFMAMLQNDGIIDDNAIGGIEVDTIVYNDAKKAKIANEMCCSVNIPPSAISNRDICDVIVRGAKMLKGMTDQYGIFYRQSLVARGIKQCFKDIPYSVSDSAKTEVYATITPAFYKWASSIDASENVNDALLRLHSIAYETIIDKANDIVSHSDALALVGRIADGENSVSVIKSLDWLRKKLRDMIASDRKGEKTNK